MNTEIVIVTGMSGAGKSIVLKALEDLGFFCVDNLPSVLVPTCIAQQTVATQKLALGIDIRGGMFDETIACVQNMRQQKIPFKIIFVTAALPTLIKRFQETRRHHPLGSATDLRDAIEQEKRLLSPLEAIADQVLATDQLTTHQLRALIRQIFAQDEAPQMMVTITSFGFKYGVPPENNFVFDARSLPNPYFVPELKMHDGTSAAIQSYLFEQPQVQEYWHKFSDFIDFSLRNAYQEGRFFVAVAIGCTGGRHRSVALVEKLAQLPLPHVQFFIKHRDIKKDLDQ